jgi:hypothetical protein
MQRALDYIDRHPDGDLDFETVSVSGEEARGFRSVARDDCKAGRGA